MASASIQAIDSFLAAHEEFERERAGRGGDPFEQLRKAAIAQFAQRGLPTTRDEDWRYTNLAPLTRTPFRRAPRAKLANAKLQPLLWDDRDADRLVFVNGRFAPDLSQVRAPADAVEVRALAGVLHSHAGAIEPYLARLAKPQHSALAALNTAFLEDGAFVHIRRGTVLDRPLHIVQLTVADGEPVFTQPRALLVADEQSQATVIETFVALGAGTYFVNAVTELVAADGAVVDHYKLNQEETGAVHVGSLHIQQGRDTVVRSHCLSPGGGLVRHNITAVLAGQGGDCHLNGLYVVAGTQHVDNHLRVEHAAPHGNSREVFKGILDGHARGVFTGRILVHKGAQKTDAKQTNKNLLLSDEAQVDTKPQLEIFANDVKCTHGATIGQLDEDAIFYLRSRGLAQQTARALLTYAFASDSLSEIRLEPLRRFVEQRIIERLPEAELLRELR